MKFIGRMYLASLNSIDASLEWQNNEVRRINPYLIRPLYTQPQTQSRSKNDKQNVNVAQNEVLVIIVTFRGVLDWEPNTRLN